MKLEITDDGLKAMAEANPLEMTDFIAGNSLNLANMKEWAEAHFDPTKTYSGPYIYYTYPVDSYHTYLKGDTYVEEGKTVTVTENFLEVLGSLDCTLVPTSFLMRSLGIVAEETDRQTNTKRKFIYAYGNISSTDKPYPVNYTEVVVYNTPARIFYNTSSDIQSDESGVPWKNFIQHTDTSVNSADGAHGLKINPDTKELTVGDTTIILSGGDERIAELEEEVRGVLKYDQQDDRIYNDEWVLRRTGTGTSGDPYKLYTPRDLDSVRENPSAYYELMNNLDLYPCTGIKARVTGTAYEILEEYDNPDAPCYNKGMGWAGFYLYRGHFNGNHKYIKNLFIGTCKDSELNSGGIFYPIPYNWSKGDYIGYRSALFMRIDQSSVSNLNIIESVILIGNSDNWGNLYAAGLCNMMTGYSTISECMSSADLLVTNTTRSGQFVGGICSRKDGECTISYCAFHGTIESISGYDSSYISGIAMGPLGSDDSRVTGCYTESQIPSFASNRAGIGFDWGTLRACYFAGYVFPRENDRNSMGTLICQRDNSNKLELANLLKNSFSLEGSSVPERVQGTILSRGYMQSRDFVNDLNALLPEPKFVYKPGGFFPRLYFEEDTIPYSAPIATIDTNTNYVLDSGYTVQTLSQMATSQDIAQLNRSLTGFIDRKSEVHTVEVQIAVSDWDGRGYKYYTPYISESGQAIDNIIIIPPDTDFFAYNIRVDYVGYDTGGNHAYEPYIRFWCDTNPSVDVAFKCIIIKGAILS